MGKKVLLLEDIHEIAKQKFQEKGFEVESIKDSLSEGQLYNKIRDVSILGIRSKTKLTQYILGFANYLECVGAFCIGTDQIDFEGCNKRGAAVFNDPISNTRSVAELAMGEIIMLFRGVFDKSLNMYHGIWNKSAETSREIRGKNLGIVGYGKIGSQLSTIAEGLGMKVYYYDTQKKLGYGNAIRCNSLDELLSISDAVTLHVDGNKNNRGFFGKEEFEKMKDKSYFLNLSRGFVVDVGALAECLDKEKILGAAIDVFEHEPPLSMDNFKSVLQGKRNVILTPHIGGNTLEAQKDIASSVSDSLISFYLQGDTSSSVNFPNISTQTRNSKIRFSHLHENVPGVLANINQVISHYGINISGQHLKTKDNFGYVVTDIEGNISKEMFDKLKNIEGTITLRVMD
jgi:D-3-phosphoglycerate dehydrogenase / 2-oxoglutarate reductase